MNDRSTCPRYYVDRLDDLPVSINIEHDSDSTLNWPNRCIPCDDLSPVKKVRFNDISTSIPYLRNNMEKTSNSIDQYYFHPERILQIHDEQPSLRYITTPLFWFLPALNHNYAICLPNPRPNLHAYITSSFDPFLPQYQSNFIPNPIRL